jgi:RNase adapter protein RapZ
MRVVLITGISGSGKSIALNVLEDDGYFCIDNLPVRFLDAVISSLAAAGHERIAVSIDARSGDSAESLRTTLGDLSRRGHEIKTLFLNARDDTLLQRYSESRRRHPLSLQMSRTGHQPTLVEAIAREREIMSTLGDLGASIDTSDLHPNALRGWVRDVVGAEQAPLTLVFISFAFKDGVPLDADLMFDARCLPNPYYTPALRPLTGRDEPVANYLRAIPAVQRLIDHIASFLHTWLPNYLQENRSYLTVAIGCTGGQHRSVFCVEELAREFRRVEHVLVRHRSLANRHPGGL